ncbi:MFS general substrate transporter [Zopfia rhizophila CBS 207.26]|uniref:MFS general substrate transporter n=1 Tax=Zopfia rhizophila CBS 207.26 TaxID=1314779 RepID=A0A6A6E165_9PEZI|nr:MFS general substrate transporter [Zopfia rhizophila CBS 207.26]
MESKEGVTHTEFHGPPSGSSVEEEVLESPPIGWRSWLTVAICSFAILAQIYTTVASGANLAFIIRDLGHPGIAPWIIQGPLVVQSVLAPMMGRLSDDYGRKWLAVVPAVIAFVGSILAARATSMTTLIGYSILFGPSLTSAAVIQSISSEILPLKWRSVSNGLAFVGGNFGGLTGSLAGGKLAGGGLHGWRHIFWLQAAFQGAVALGFLVAYWPQPVVRKKRSVMKAIWSFDPVGSLAYVFGVTLLLLGLNWGGGSYPWKSAYVLAPLIIGILLLAFFGVYEWKGRSDGLVAHVLFARGRNFLMAMIAMVMEGWIFYGAFNNIIPQVILNLGFESTGLAIAVRQLSGNIPSLASALIIMWYSTKYRDLKSPLIAAYCCFLISNICYAALNEHMQKAQYGFALIMGLGLGGPLAMLSAVIQLSVPHRYLSAATGLGFSARAIGGAFGSAVLNAIINKELASNLNQDVSAAAVAAGLDPKAVPALLMGLAIGDPTVIAAVPGINPGILSSALAVSRHVYAKAYRLGFSSVIPFSVLALIACCFLQSVKEYMTEEVEATVEHVPVKTERTTEKGISLEHDPRSK